MIIYITCFSCYPLNHNRVVRQVKIYTSYIYIRSFEFSSSLSHKGPLPLWQKFSAALVVSSGLMTNRRHTKAPLTPLFCALTRSHDAHTPKDWLQQLLLFGFLHSLTCFCLDIFFPSFYNPQENQMLQLCIYVSRRDMLVSSSVVYSLNMATGCHWTQCTFLLYGIKIIKICLCSLSHFLKVWI